MEAAPEAAPAAPAVTVGRAGRDWTIAIVAPEDRGGWAGTLTLASSGDAGPVIWTYDVSAPGAPPAAGEPDA